MKSRMNNAMENTSETSSIWMHLDPLSDKNLHSSNRPRCIMTRTKITTNSCGGLSEQRMWHHWLPHTNLSQPIQNQQTNLMPRSQIFAQPDPTQTIKSPENATGCPGPAPEPSQVRVEEHAIYSRDYPK